jgi:IMP cyclohydrolase
MFELDPQENLVILRANPYPGRGLIIGINAFGTHAVQIYWIMGRSQNSRNRIFRHEGGRLFTAVANPAEVTDPSLIFYNAMDEATGVFVVSNGRQTDSVIEILKDDSPLTFPEMLEAWQYEPDEPHFTPRITGTCRLIEQGLCQTELVLLRRSTFLEGNQCLRCHYDCGQIKPGIGFCLTTYAGDGNPLPPFTGEPFPLPLPTQPDETLETYWQALNPENRVALAVKTIDLGSGQSEIIIRNRFAPI